jgi:hypothetical protein
MQRPLKENQATVSGSEMPKSSLAVREKDEDGGVVKQMPQRATEIEAKAMHASGSRSRSRKPHTNRRSAERMRA